MQSRAKLRKKYFWMCPNHIISPNIHIINNDYTIILVVESYITHVGECLFIAAK